MYKSKQLLSRAGVQCCIMGADYIELLVYVDQQFHGQLAEISRT